jgi:hypothetical protein
MKIIDDSQKNVGSSSIPYWIILIPLIIGFLLALLETRGFI